MALSNAESLDKEMFVSFANVIKFVDRVDEEAPAQILITHRAQNHTKSVTWHSLDFIVSEEAEDLV